MNRIKEFIKNRYDKAKIESEYKLSRPNRSVFLDYRKHLKPDQEYSFSDNGKHAILKFAEYEIYTFGGAHTIAKFGIVQDNDKLFNPEFPMVEMNIDGDLFENDGHIKPLSKDAVFLGKDLLIVRKSNVEYTDEDYFKFVEDNNLMINLEGFPTWTSSALDHCVAVSNARDMWVNLLYKKGYLL